MPLGETTFTQRAIRRFGPDPIRDAGLRDTLKAAIHAPTGGTLQPWRFLATMAHRMRAHLASLLAPLGTIPHQSLKRRLT